MLLGTSLKVLYMHLTRT
jgi:HJR/Mrr/RecB family endonuclease